MIFSAEFGLSFCLPPKDMLKDRNFEVEEVRREKMGVLPIQIVTRISR
ncbi:MAG: hypothetical protein ACLFSM_06610 [Thermoplasmata archaeon]